LGDSKAQNSSKQTTAAQVNLQSKANRLQSAGEQRTPYDPFDTLMRAFAVPHSTWFSSFMGIINWLTKPFTIVFLAQERSRRGGTSRFRMSAGALLDVLSLSLSLSCHILLIAILCRLVQCENIAALMFCQFRSSQETLIFYSQARVVVGGGVMQYSNTHTMARFRTCDASY
jgi:hypothetical protein